MQKVTLHEGPMKSVHDHIGISIEESTFGEAVRRRPKQISYPIGSYGKRVNQKKKNKI